MADNNDRTGYGGYYQGEKQLRYDVEALFRPMTPRSIKTAQDIRDLRLSMGSETRGGKSLTRAEFAERVRTKATTVYRWETGRSKPSGLFPRRLELIRREAEDVEDVLFEHLYSLAKRRFKSVRHRSRNRQRKVRQMGTHRAKKAGTYVPT